MINITIPNMSDGLAGMVVYGNAATNGIALPSVLFIIFIGAIIMLKNSRIGLPIASLVTMFIAYIFRSLGWISEAVLLPYLVIFVLSIIYLATKK